MYSSSGRSDHSESGIVLSPFLLGRSFCLFTLFLQGLMDDDFVKPLLSGLFRFPWKGLGQSGNSSGPACVARVEEYYSFFHLLGMYHDF